MARLVNASWFFFKLALAGALVAGIVAAPHLWRRVDEEVRRRVEAKLAELYPDLQVTVGSARFLENRGVVIRDVRLAEPSAAGPRPEILHIEEVLVACTTNLADLVAGRIEVQHVEVHRPTIRATRRPDGSWSAARLRPAKCSDIRKPPGIIDGLVIELFDPTGSRSQALTLCGARIAWQPVANSGQAAAGERVACRAELSCEFLSGVQLTSQIDIAAQKLVLSGKVNDLNLCPELLASLPGLPAEALELRGLRASANGDFSLSYDPAADEPLEFSADLQLSAGRLQDRRLPGALTELSGRVICDRQGLRVQKLVARGGQASLSLDAARHGWAADSPITIDARLTRFPIDRPLADLLPPSLATHWDKYLPVGLVDADVHAHFDGRRWHPRLDVQLLDVAFTYYRFPYRLAHGRGRLAWHDRVLELNMQAYSGDYPVRIDGRILDPGPQFTGKVDVQVDELPLDERLIAAFPSKAAEVMRTLHPAGRLSVNGTVWRDDPAEPLVHQQADVRIWSGSMRYERFIYPVAQIEGQLTMHDGRWTVEKLEGSGNGGRITASGELSTGSSGAQLDLQLTASDLPLDEDLRAALSPGMQKAWDTLRPHGVIDLPAVQLGYRGPGQPLSVELTALARGENTSVEPICFSYRMEKLAGTIHYANHRAWFDRLEAAHGSTTLVAAGEFEANPLGDWQLNFKKLTVNRLRPERDRELVAALPAALRQLVLQLRPSGQMDIDGSLSFARGAAADSAVRTRWDLALDVHQGQIDCGVRLENVFGAVRLVGSSDGRRFATSGELSVQSLMYRNWQFTDFRGPLWADEQRVLLGGSAAPAVPGQAPRRMTARFSGGVLIGDCQIGIGPVTQYAVQASLTEADLSRLAQENLAGRQQLGGKVMGQVSFQGNSKGIYTLSGAGGVRLHDADIYELPVMVSLLKILSIKPPDTTAFDKSDIDFRIEGDRLLFDRINFNGDAISLVGQGQMGLDSSVKLTFHSIVGRDDFRIPLLSSVMGRASQEMMQIHVEGTFDKPSTRSEILPSVNQALQQLQEELQMGAEPSAPLRR